jgi:signal transduction histidine kinase/CheY-like chemotaxis protein
MGTYMVRLDTQGRLLLESANPAADRILDVAHQALLGRPFDEALPSLSGSPLPNLLRETMRPGGLPRTEQIHLGQSPHDRTLEFHVFPVSANIAATYFSDISTRDQQNRRLIEQARLDAIGQLAAGISHDYNNKLAIITGFAEIIARRVEDSQLRGFARKIINTTYKAAELNRQLLAFSQRANFLPSPTNAHTLILEAVNVLSRTLSQRIVLEHHLEASSPFILCDAQLLRGALLALGVNAGEAMPEGGTLRFSTSCERLGKRTVHPALEPGEYLCITISDTGIGMTEEVRQRAVEPFFTTKPFGTSPGLGLAAAFGTARSFGGDIDVQSAPGKGTRITLRIPICEERPKQNESAPSPQDSLPLTLERPHILFVEDEQELREVAQIHLAAEGYRVTVMSDGEKAVSYYETHGATVDLILMDLNMPRLDGHQTFAAIRQVNPNARVIALSGYSASTHWEPLRADGFLDFIQKPVQQDELLKHIARYVRPKR